MASCDRSKTLVLFDVDGTLTRARLPIEPEMVGALSRLKEKATIGFVGGSNLEKQREQLGELACGFFDFSFAENGLTAYRGTSLIGQASFIGELGEDRYKALAAFTLHYIAELDIPIKRGTFLEFRAGMINVSPIGRDCTYEERLDFAKLDGKEGIRQKMVEAYKQAFPGFGLVFSIGGQISIDIFPVGWDKTYCLRHVRGEAFEDIHFFGDKTEQGGNDFELFTHPAVKGHRVVSPEDTLQQLSELFGV